MNYLTVDAAILALPEEWGDKVDEVWRDVRGRIPRDSRIDCLGEWPPDGDRAYVIVVRLSPSHDDVAGLISLNWYRREFSEWRRTTPPETFLPYVTNPYPSNSLTNPYERGFQGVVGRHDEADYSVDFCGKHSDFARSSFLQFYDGYDPQIGGDNRFRYLLTTNDENWTFLLIGLLTERYCPQRCRWSILNPDVTKVGRAALKVGGALQEPSTIVYIDAALKESMEQWRSPQQDNHLEGIAHATKETISFFKSQKQSFTIRAKIELRYLDGNEDPQRVYSDRVICVLKGRRVRRTDSFLDFVAPRNASGPPVFRDVVIRPDIQKVERDGNTLVCPDNPFVIWDCLWEAVFSTKATDSIQSSDKPGKEI